MADGALAMSWIEALVQNIERLLKFVLPCRVVRSYRRAIVFRLGVPHRVKTGFFWLWPFCIEEESQVVVNVQTRNLLTQSMTTKDEAQVSFSVNVSYQITDAMAYYCEVADFETALDALAMVHLAAKVREKTWTELLADQKKMEKSLGDTLTTRVKDWGVEILVVGFTDLVKTRAYRLFGDMGAESKNQKAWTQ